MPYSETKVIIGGLANVPILILFLMKLKIKIRTGIWASPPMITLVSE